MSGAPIGELFEVEIGGEKRQYHILPRVFSSATMEALGRVYKQAARDLVKENLKTASEIRKVDETVYKDFMADVVKEATGRVFVGYEQALEALSTRDGVITALTLNCTECMGKREAAVELVDNCTSVLDLMASVINAGNEALEAAKNSLPPETPGETNETEEIPS